MDDILEMQRRLMKALLPQIETERRAIEASNTSAVTAYRWGGARSGSSTTFGRSNANPPRIVVIVRASLE
jgi:hypothetical protein